MITGKTKLLGIIGEPVEHSLSPVMHNAAIAHLGVDYIYVPFPVKREKLAQALEGFSVIGVRGFSITIPHKQTIMPLLEEITPTAKLVGAVNTVWRTERGWHGTNTDVEGFLSPLRRMGIEWSQVTPVVLGNGGAARAVVVGCFQLGCPEIYVLGRNQDNLDHFCQSWQNTPLEGKIKGYGWDNLSGLVSATKLLINTTPVGMYPKVDESPLEAEIIEKLSSQTIVYDLIYIPNPTLLLKQAQAKGARIIDGLEMLVQQGASALEMWLGQPVPVDIMTQSLREYLLT